MKNIFIIFCGLYFSLAYCQEKKAYPFFVELNHFSNAPKFIKQGNRMIYAGANEKEKAFFAKYEILEFYQAFPDSRRPRTLNMFTVQSLSKTLMADMVREFPEKYVRVEDLSGMKIELLDSYTNDYGTTLPPSEGLNLGIPLSSLNYDYVNVPKAWDYTYGNSEIIIGISDQGFDITDDDFEFKSTILPGSSNPSYSLANSSHWHATFVASIAAAQGDNGHGMAGICSDCSILYAAWLYGNPGTESEPLPDTNRLLQMAIAGARVINMSWIGGAVTTTTPVITYQWVIDELHDDYNMVMVAGSGNKNPWDVNPTNGILYYYPASYNHVISVSGVNHKYGLGELVTSDSTYGDVSWYAEDMISPVVAMDYPPGNGPYGFPQGPYSSPQSVTHNDRVDIVAPAFYIPVYPWEVLNHPDHRYGIGSTSGATPHVTGTVGLMLSLNGCLINDEVEDIIQLTSKNIEAMPGNQPFAGKIGAGKLETGDAVEFVYEMMQTTGNALIAGQDFYRFDFNLSHINNKLTVSNQKFRDNCTADFTAKNMIDVLPGSDFNPNTNGYVDLKINDAITVCEDPGMPRMNMHSPSDKPQELEMRATKLSPNPNDGTFNILLGDKLKGEVTVKIFDLSGKVIYHDKFTDSFINLNLPGLSSGMYIVQLSSESDQETIKFIKK